MEQNNTLRKILNVVLCIVLLLSVVATVLVLDARTLTARDNLRSLISAALTRSAPARLPIRGALAVGFPGARLDDAKPQDNAVLDSLVDAAYATLQKELGENFDISREDFDTMLEKTTLLDFASDKAADILSDICTGNVTATLTGEEVRTLLEENRAVIEQELSITISDENIQAAADWVEQANVMDTVQNIVLHPEQVGSGDIALSPPDANLGSSGVQTSVPASALPSGIAVAVKSVQAVTAPAMLIGALLACAVFTALLFVVNRKHIPTALFCSGSIYLAAGILTVLPWAAAVCVPSLWQDPIMRVVAQALRLTGLAGGVTCLLGAALIAGGVAVKTVSRRKAAQV